MLEADVQAKILSLYFSDKKSIRAISILVGVDRKTVKRIINRKQVALEKRLPIRTSQLDPFKDQIKNFLHKDPTMAASTMLHRLRDHGFNGGITILRDYVKTLKSKSPKIREAFLRLEFAPGECAQVDWGEFGDVFGTGVKIHCFVMVMCYSRMTYIEFTRSERFEDFIRCHENAFRYFGGAPKECWYDNLATAVQDRLGSVVKFNPRFFAYMGHHNILPHACNPARGNEKGRVENGIKFIRGHFWSGRSFKDFNDLCMQSILWRDQYLNLRDHRVTKRIVRSLFIAEEQHILLKLNDLIFSTDEVLTKVITPDFHIIFESNRYSVPWTFVGLALTIRINDKSLKMYYQEKYVAGHERSYLKNKIFTNPKHQESLLSKKPGAVNQEAHRIEAIKNLGAGVKQYFDSLKASSRSLKSELTRLLALSTVYGADSLNSACFEMIKDGIIGVDKLERYLKVENVATKNPAPLKFSREKLNRIVPAMSLSSYDELLSPNKSTQEGDDENGN